MDKIMQMMLGGGGLVNPEFEKFKRVLEPLLDDRDLPYEMGFAGLTVYIGGRNELSISMLSYGQVEGLLKKDGRYREDIWQKRYNYDEVNLLVDEIVRLKANPPKEEDEE